MCVTLRQTDKQYCRRHHPYRPQRYVKKRYGAHKDATNMTICAARTTGNRIHGGMDFTS